MSELNKANYAPMSLPLTVSAPTTNQLTPSTFTLPIQVSDTTGDGVYSFQFNILYDPAVINPQGTSANNFGCTTAGTLAGTAGLSVICNVIPGEEGKLRVAAYGTAPMTGSGVLLNTSFTTTAARGSSSILNFDSAVFFNDAGPTVPNIVNGSVTIKDPAAATVTNSPQIFDGTPKSATVACLGGGVASNIRLNGQPTQTAVGTYAVLADCAASAGYTAGTSINAGTFAIVNPTVVTLGDTNWTYYDDQSNAVIPNLDFVFGPATPPLGIGSARFAGGPSSGPGSLRALATTQFAGTRLADIMGLRYSTYGSSTAADPNNIPTLQFNVDFDLTDGDDSYQNRVVFSPLLNGTVVTDQWQDWDAANGVFWYSGAAPSGTQCSIAAPCTKAKMLSEHPNMGIHKANGPTAGNYGALLFRVQPSSNSNADKLMIGINNGANRAFDFEPGTSITTVTCPAAAQTYTGSPILPCTYGVTGAETGNPVLVAAGTPVPPGNYTANTNVGTAGASFTYAGDANHSGSSNSKTFTISAKAATVTANNQTVNYGQADPSFTFSTTGVVSPDTLTGVTCGVTPAHTNAGTYSITCSGNTNTNYSVTYVAGTLTVNKLALTVTASSHTVTYGDPIPSVTATYATFVNGDTGAVISGQTCTTTYTVTSAAGSVQTTSCSGGSATNYTLTYIAGSVTVNPKGLIITADNRSKAFGTTATFAGTEFTTSGLINGNTVTSVTLTSTGAPAAAGAGMYPIVPSSAVGSGLSNYAISYVNGTLTVGCQTNPVVTISGDSGTGSLRAAISNACVGDTITFNIAAAGPHTIQLATPLPTLARNVTVVGPTNVSVTISGGGSGNPFSVFTIGSGATVNISNLNITNGFVISGCGGGIRNDHGILTLNAMTLYGNSADQGAGVCNLGTGAGPATIMAIYNSTVSGNTATGEGGGLSNQGQASGNAMLTVINSTIAGNSATSGAGIFNYGFNGGNGVTNIKNTILANGATGGNLNSSTTAGAGGIVSQGYNLSNDAVGGNGTTAPGGFLNAGGDIRNTNPLIGPLAFNGGPTRTHNLLNGSPAIDQGSAASTALAELVAPIVTDQRGSPRPIDFNAVANAPGGNGSDIGAVELQVATAAGVSISGHVLTSEGRGITNSLVTVSGNSLAEPRSAVTGRGGAYSFEGLQAGETYILTVAGRRYSFSTPSRVISLVDNATDIDFIADPAQ